MARIFNIELKFSTSGAKELRLAIQAIAKEQRKLAEAQQKLNKESKATIAQNKKLIMSEEKHRMAMLKQSTQLAKLREQLRKVTYQNEQLRVKAEANAGALGRLRRATAGLQARLGAIRNTLLLATFAFGSFVAGMRNAINTAAQFEAVKVRLNSMFGSVERGTKAFNTFNKIAATTPFTLQDVVEAGAALKAFGTDSERLIKPVSDLAAFMGVTATEAAQALGRAFAGGAGAADILRERGILQLVRDFKGIDDLSKLTLPEFRKALEETLLDPASGIAGATDKLSKTTMGMMSNMADAFSRMSAAFGELIAVEDTIGALTSLFSSLEKVLTKLNTSDIDRIKELTQALGIKPEDNSEIEKRIEAIALEMAELQKITDPARTYKQVQDELNQARAEELRLRKEYNTLKPANEYQTMGEEGIAIGFQANQKQKLVEQLEKELNALEKIDVLSQDLTKSTLDLEVANSDLFSSYANFDKVVAPFAAPILKPRGLFPSNEDLAKGLQVFSDNLATQLEGFDKEKLSRAFESLLEFEQLFQDQLVNGFMNSFNQILSMQQQNLDARIRNEINALKKTDKYRNASMEQRQTMEDDIRAKFADQQKRIFQAQKAMQITKVIIDTAAAINQLMQTALAASVLDPSAPARAKAISIAMGAVSAAQIGLIAAQKPPAFARGGSFITNGQQMIMVGDNAGGRERVDITPISSPDFGDAGGGNGITVNIMGNVIGTQEFVRDNLLPEIENSIRRNLA